jgi:hypothetical protein
MSLRYFEIAGKLFADLLNTIFFLDGLIKKIVQKE